MKAKLSLLIPLLTFVGLVACTAAIPVSSTSTVATTSTTTTTTSPVPILVDANGAVLGVPIQDGVFYNPQLKRNISYGYGELGRYLRNNAIQGSFAYTGNDCTGTLYLVASDPAIAYTWVHALNGNFYIVSNTTPATRLQMRSQTAFGYGCGSIDSASTPWNVYALERIDLPFNVPIAMPLYYK
jgi:hypothetical protein